MKRRIMLLAVVVLAGCAVGSKRPVEIYDFGIPAAVVPPAGQDVFLVDIRAVEWLGTTDMLYRLEYANPRKLAPYALSRWAAPPAHMLTVRLRQSVSNATSVRGKQTKCSLALFLSEFSQVFGDEQNSRAVMHLRATLSDPAATEAARVREFRLEKPAPTPNAAGAAAASAAIATSVAEELNAWIAEAGVCKR